MRTWTKLWVSVVIQWVAGTLFILALEFLHRLAGDKPVDPMPIVLFFLLLVFVNTVAKDLHKGLEDMGQRSGHIEDALAKLDRWRRIEMGESEESDYLAMAGKAVR